MAELFTLDLRTLAVLRVSLGVLLLVDLGARAVDFRAFYTDDGVLPRELLRAEVLHPLSWSLHSFLGSGFAQAVLFVVAALLACVLIAGYQTRWVTIASWFLLASLHTRNPLILQGGDLLLQHVLFWSIFLPLGARYSVDAGKGEDGTHTSIAVAALLLQITFVYYFTAMLKAHPIWISEGSAMFYALSLKGFSTHAGRMLLAYPGLLRVGTFTVMAIELLGPLVSFLPFATQKVRPFAALVMIGFHMGTAVFMKVGLFPYIASAAWLVFLLTPWAWGKIPHRLRAAVAGFVTPWLERAHARRTGARHAFRLTRVERVVVAVFLVMAFVSNVGNVKRFGVKLPSAYLHVVDATRLYQQWALFAPHPLVAHGWIVAAARLEDGSEVDLWEDGAPVTDAEPDYWPARWDRQRWRKYLTHMWMAHTNDDHFERYSTYPGWLCADWNRRHPDRRAEHVRIEFVYDYTILPGREPLERERSLLFDVDCR